MILSLEAYFCLFRLKVMISAEALRISAWSWWSLFWSPRTAAGWTRTGPAPPRRRTRRCPPPPPPPPPPARPRLPRGPPGSGPAGRGRAAAGAGGQEAPAGVIWRSASGTLTKLYCTVLYYSYTLATAIFSTRLQQLLVSAWNIKLSSRASNKGYWRFYIHEEGPYWGLLSLSHLRHY